MFDTNANYEAGNMLISGIEVPPSNVSAIHYFEVAAANGDARARKKLDEIKKNKGSYSDAEVQRFSQLSYARNGDDQLALSQCYFFGIGVEQNLDESEKWLREASYLRIPTAVSMLQLIEEAAWKKNETRSSTN